MPKKHELGDYLYKDGNIYKIIPNWGSERVTAICIDKSCRTALN